MCPITAIDIEGLVRWTYQVQCADVIIGTGVGLYSAEAWVDGVDGRAGSCGYGFDSAAKVRRGALLGCLVDSSGSGRGDLHPDAEAVHDAVLGLIRGDRGAGLLVLQFGIAGLRPDWREGAYPRWEPCQTRQRPNGEWVAVYQYDDGFKGGKRPWFCPMRMVDGPESIAYQRRVYAAWHGGLVWLVGKLGANRSCLIHHVATGPKAPEAPWEARNYTGFQIGLDRLAENR